MKKRYRCNDTRFTNGEDRDRIRFKFLSVDGNTPSSCTVRLGDVDPVTGQTVADVTFFREYYRLVDHQVHKNMQALRPDYTPRQKAWREAEAEAYIRDFTERWGYAPSRDDVLYYLGEKEGNRWNQYLDTFVSPETGYSTVDRHAELSAPAEMDAEEPLELQALREVAASLSGREAEVYEVMLLHAGGDKESVRYADLAEKWGVAPKQVSKVKARIMEKVRKKAEELRREEEE